jgi:hypothetical protein
MKILVIGGYGNFGKRLVHSLLCHYDHEIIIAGRSLSKACAFIECCRRETGKTPAIARLDVVDSDLTRIFSDLAVDMVVNASGPFQLQAGAGNYRVARSCAENGVHYVDLADDRRYVCEFSAALDDLATDNEVCLVTGASTVPGLTGAVLDHYSSRFTALEEIDYGISPGNRSERGAATVASILSYTGRPFDTLTNGIRQPLFGWQNLRRVDLGAPVNRRWMGNCDIPDLELLPAKYPDLKTLRFQAGLEVSILHLGLWSLSLLSRIGIVDNLSRFAAPLTRMSNWFLSRGSDCGAMFVEIEGLVAGGHRRRVSWQLVAENGVGPNIPTIAAELVIDKIATGGCRKGAMPCLGLFELGEFLQVADRWGIYQKEVCHV